MATKHRIRVIAETTNRTKTTRERVVMQLQGAGGGVHAVLLSTPTLKLGDQRLKIMKSAMDDLAGPLRSLADHLCSCPAPGEIPGWVPTDADWWRDESFRLRRLIGELQLIVSDLYAMRGEDSVTADRCKKILDLTRNE